MSAIRSSVLIVDDEVFMRETIAESLSEHYKVYFARNGIEAIKVAADTRPSAIVLDYNLPELNGTATCKQLRNFSPTQSIPIIMISGEIQDDIKEKCIDAGANDFVPKPFEISQLVNLIKNKIFSASDLNANPYKRFLDLDFETNRIKFDNIEKKVTPIEMKIIKFLAERFGKLVKTIELTDHIWGQNSNRHRPLGPHIASIRKILANSNLEIVTLYAHGFVLREKSIEKEHAISES